MIRIPILISRASLYLLALVVISLFPFIQAVYAHAYSASYTTLDLTQSQTSMTYALDELSVIELIGGDLNQNGMMDQGEFATVKDRFEAILQENIILTMNGETKTWTQAESFLDRQGEATKVMLKVRYPPVSPSLPVYFEDHLYMNNVKSNYVNLLTIQDEGQKSTIALSGEFRTWTRIMTVDNDSVSEQTNPISAWHSFFRLGMNHILGGFDHLLFLFSLLIARQTFKQYAMMITAFTIAHSITLTLTVLGLIDISPKLVEPAIALSICYVALDNIVRSSVSRRWVLTFLFGLIHGMGFADILKEMNIPRSNIAAALLSFNIGIEVVQIALVGVLVPLIYLLYRYKYARRFVVAGSIAAFVLGGIWLFERLFAV